MCILLGCGQDSCHFQELVTVFIIALVQLSEGVCVCVCVYTCSCPLTPVVSKASAGAMEIVQVYAVGSMSGMLKVREGGGVG